MYRLSVLTWMCLTQCHHCPYNQGIRRIELSQWRSRALRSLAGPVCQLRTGEGTRRNDRMHVQMHNVKVRPQVSPPLTCEGGHHDQLH